uniref:Uncharacterized protein n=1 Tax=Quercus lobata TaxID=97700 RepID=A0A7N2LHG4_QUELO
MRQELGIGPRVGCMLPVDNLRLPLAAYVSAAAVAAIVSSIPSLALWHARLSHASSSQVQHLGSRDHPLINRWKMNRSKTSYPTLSLGPLAFAPLEVLPQDIPPHHSTQADVVEENKRTATFSWITGLCAASHVLGNLLALFLPEKYNFPVSIALLIFCSVHMQLFLVETVKLAPKRDQVSACLTTPIKIIQKRYKSMKDAATIVMSSPTLRGISLVSFFFELGKSGINCVLMNAFVRFIVATNLNLAKIRLSL